MKSYETFKSGTLHLITMLIEELSIDQKVLKGFIWTWNNEKWKLPAKDLMTVETILMNDYFVICQKLRQSIVYKDRQNS